ncbi:hypothetical protein ACFL35_16940, partial [Candidatus Riflebacteria bacterium]
MRQMPDKPDFKNWYRGLPRVFFICLVAWLCCLGIIVYGKVLFYNRYSAQVQLLKQKEIQSFLYRISLKAQNRFIQQTREIELFFKELGRRFHRGFEKKKFLQFLKDAEQKGLVIAFYLFDAEKKLLESKELPGGEKGGDVSKFIQIMDPFRQDFFKMENEPGELRSIAFMPRGSDGDFFYLVVRLA